MNDREQYLEEAADCVYELCMPDWVPESLRYKVEDAINGLVCRMNGDELEKCAVVECAFTTFDNWLKFKYKAQEKVFTQKERLF